MIDNGYGGKRYSSANKSIFKNVMLNGIFNDYGLLGIPIWHVMDLNHDSILTDVKQRSILESCRSITIHIDLTRKVHNAIRPHQIN